MMSYTTVNGSSVSYIVNDLVLYETTTTLSSPHLKAS